MRKKLHHFPDTNNASFYKYSDYSLFQWNDQIINQNVKELQKGNSYKVNVPDDSANKHVQSRTLNVFLQIVYMKRKPKLPSLIWKVDRKQMKITQNVNRKTH